MGTAFWTYAWSAHNSPPPQAHRALAVGDGVGVRLALGVQLQPVGSVPLTGTASRSRCGLCWTRSRGWCRTGRSRLWDGILLWFLEFCSGRDDDWWRDWHWR